MIVVFGRLAFVASMVVLAVCAWMVDQGGLWIVGGVIFGVPSALVWGAGLLFGALELAERRDGTGRTG